MFVLSVAWYRMAWHQSLFGRRWAMQELASYPPPPGCTSGHIFVYGNCEYGTWGKNLLWECRYFFPICGEATVQNKTLLVVHGQPHIYMLHMCIWEVDRIDFDGLRQKSESGNSNSKV